MKRENIVIKHRILKQRLIILLQDIQHVKKLIDLRNDYNIIIKQCKQLKI